MKRALFLVAFLLLIPMSMSFGQSELINIHGYSHGWLADDSSNSVWWSIAGGDVDTSDWIDIKGYTYLSSYFEFGYNTAGGGDSIAVSVYCIASWDDTVYVLIDSIAASPLVTAELVTPVSSDTACFKIWTLPAASRAKIIIKGWEGATDKATGIKARVHYWKMK